MRNNNSLFSSDVVETTDVETETETRNNRDRDRDRDQKMLRKYSRFNYFKNHKFLFSKLQSKITFLLNKHLDVRRVSSVVTSATHVQNDLVRFSVTSIE